MTNMIVKEAKFSVGEKVKHELLQYRGVILDVDAAFDSTEDWYEKNAKISKPSKKQPWYHVLVHDSSHVTYVAEQNLSHDVSDDAVSHPAVEMCFHQDEDGSYHRRTTIQ